MAIFVGVHGAGGRASYWRLVAAELEARGHDVGELVLVASRWRGSSPRSLPPGCRSLMVREVEVDRR